MTHSPTLEGMISFLQEERRHAGTPATAISDERYEINVVEDRYKIGVWIVETIDVGGDGGVSQTHFYGWDPERRARDYAGWSEVSLNSKPTRASTSANPSTRAAQIAVLDRAREAVDGLDAPAFAIGESPRFAYQEGVKNVLAEIDRIQSEIEK